jgi:hypothetical protein
MTMTWTPAVQKNAAGAFEPTWSITGQFGKGSSDREDTPDTREDYIGEAPTFSADTILMSTFAGKINATGNVIIGPSLANKTLRGVQIVTNKWSGLAYIADAFGVGDDVNSRSATLRMRQYRFGRPVYASTGSREAVLEYSFEMAVEVPKGVRTTLGAGYMSPRAGITPVIADDPWVFSLGVSLTL